MKNLKKFAAFGIAAAMTVSMGVSAFAADPALVANGEEKAINFKTGEAGADISVSTEDQITVLAYLVDEKDSDGNAYTTATVPEVGNASEIVAINQVEGATGFGEIPLDVDKLVSGKIMVVKLGGSDGTVENYIVKYNKTTETIELLVGDVDGDGRVTADDASIIDLFASILSDTDKALFNEEMGTNIGVKVIKADGTIYVIGDIDGDDKPTADDASIIDLYASILKDDDKASFNDEVGSITGTTILIKK